MEADSKQAVFMAFLGTGRYVACRYGSIEAPVDRYVQTASLRKVEAENGKVAGAFILCTEGAKKRHWPGLHAEFIAAGLTEPECVDIDDALVADGMWRVFRTVVEQVPKGAALYFDATHSFRSLSIIMTVMFNYLKVAKQVDVRACYYGVWEAARDRNGGRFPLPPSASDADRDRCGADLVAPLVDLRPFLQLNDWTTAIGDFLDYGDAGGMVQLSHRQLGASLAVMPADQRSGSCEVALRKAITAIGAFCDKIKLAYLGTQGNERSIVGGDDCRSIVKYLTRASAGEDVTLPQLQPLLQELQTTFQRLDVADETARGLNAAAWAAEHGMIPQAYTLLQETIISCLLTWLTPREPVLSRENLDVVERRGIVSGVLGCWVNTRPGNALDWHGGGCDLQTAERIAARLPRELLPLYVVVTNCRNVLNHAGTNERGSAAKLTRNYVADDVQKLIAQVRTVLAKLENVA